MILWNEKLPNNLQVYTQDNICNADETEIFYKMLPEKTMEFKDVNCHGGNTKKERITGMVCANMSGTVKLPPLVIGRTLNPRCFKHAKSLPLKYYSSKKGMDDFSNLYRMGEETREEDALDEKEDCANRGQLSSSSIDSRP